MKKLLAVLPVFALVLGIGAAIASNKTHDVANSKRAKISGQWIDITGKQVNVDYVCDTAPTHDCTAEFNPQGQMISGTLVKGDYRPL